MYIFTRAASLYFPPPSLTTFSAFPIFKAPIPPLTMRERELISSNRMKPGRALENGPSDIEFPRAFETHVSAK